MADLNDDPEASDGAPRETASPEAGQGVYRVLARKYRPQSFADLIGQDPLVRTLTNAIESGRIAQAYILTGVRGVGKTTTARILAKALNYVGTDGTAGPTAGPTDDCAICRAIAEDRHVDVIEMDAASRTGVGDIRELIEGVRYRPVEARYKIYIIDEVHMLSTSAFNALLKTLEEPPPHVVFIFATTEIRKVPVTVLSRCQRFDLRRVDQGLLAAHFARIAAAEGVTAEEGAIQLVARAADGSVRDGLSLLDQAIALTGGAVTEQATRDMLGIADRARLYDMLEAVLGGRMAEALAVLKDLYDGGTDPVTVLQDLLEAVHFATRARLVPDSAKAPGVPETERTRGLALSERLSLAELARAWQILLKGHGEAQMAPLPLQAAEMVLIRLAHASDMPTPGELVRQLQAGGASGGASGGGGGPRRAGGERAGGERAGGEAGGAATARSLPAPAPASEPTAAASQAAPQETPRIELASFPALVALAREHGAHQLANVLEVDVSLVAFRPGALSLHLLPEAPADLVPKLRGLLAEWTGRDWQVEPAAQAGEAPLRQQAQAARRQQEEAALQHPLALALLSSFPGAKLVAHRRPPEATPPAGDPLSPGGGDVTSAGSDDAAYDEDPARLLGDEAGLFEDED